MDECVAVGFFDRLRKLNFKILKSVTQDSTQKKYKSLGINNSVNVSIM